MIFSFTCYLDPLLDSKRENPLELGNNRMLTRYGFVMLMPEMLNNALLEREYRVIRFGE
jgi:hypothetical protein